MKRGLLGLVIAALGATLVTLLAVWCGYARARARIVSSQ